MRKYFKYSMLTTLVLLMSISLVHAAIPDLVHAAIPNIGTTVQASPYEFSSTSSYQLLPISIKPNGDVLTQTGWSIVGTGLTYHYQAVDDWPINNGDTDYVKFAAAYAAPAKVDVFSLEDAPANALEGIGKIIVKAIAKKATGTTSVRFKVGIRVGTSMYNTTDIAAFNLTTSWALYSTTWATNPKTSAAWTWADITALQAGVMPYTGVDATYWLGVTMLWVEVCPAVRVMPQVMGFGSYACVGKEFAITMEISNVMNLYGFDIKCGWDTAWVQYINHTLHVPVETYPDGVLHEVPLGPILLVMDEVDELGIPGTPAGTMCWFACAAEAPSPAFNGSGVVFDMFFRIKAQPTKLPNAVFNFHITQSQVSNSTGWAIDHGPLDATVTIYNTKADWHDVAVTSVTTDKTIVDPGDSVDVTVVVKNLGDFTQTFDVTAYNLTGYPPGYPGYSVIFGYAGYSGSGYPPPAGVKPGYYSTVIGTQTVSGLASKASQTLHFTWHTTGGEGYYVIKAVASTVPSETAFPFDNTRVDGAVYVIRGDFDADGGVDHDDLVIVPDTFGSSSGQPTYDERVDIDRDGQIGADDVYLFARDYGLQK